MNKFNTFCYMYLLLIWKLPVIDWAYALPKHNTTASHLDDMSSLGPSFRGTLSSTTSTHRDSITSSDSNTPMPSSSLDFASPSAVNTLATKSIYSSSRVLSAMQSKPTKILQYTNSNILLHQNNTNPTISSTNTARTSTEQFDATDATQGPTSVLSTASALYSSQSSTSTALPSTTSTNFQARGVSTTDALSKIPSSVFVRDTTLNSLAFQSSSKIISGAASPPSPMAASVYPMPVPFSKNLSTMPSTNAPACTATGTCCLHGLGQLAPSIAFEESMSAGHILIDIKGMQNVSIDVQVIKPHGLGTILLSYFTITNTGTRFTLSLKREMDLEDLYLKANKQADVHRFQIQLKCTEHGMVFPSPIIHVTVEDVDDNMPVFEHGASGPSCVVPVYKAGTNEHYTGELTVSPGKIKAVDGDLTKKNNITYAVLHSEPDNYHEYFYVDSVEGTVNKTRTMNASDPRKYVLFVQAMEDSPNQKTRVAILSIEVYAPLQKGEVPVTVDPTVKSALQIISALVLIAFAAGFLVIIHHRYRQSKLKVDINRPTSVEQDVRLPKLAVYQSSTSSLNSLIPDIPEITSPSQVAVAPRQKVLHKKQKKIIVKKPLDTSARPGWNAPSQKSRKFQYNPYTSTTVLRLKQK